MPDAFPIAQSSYDVRGKPPKSPSFGSGAERKDGGNVVVFNGLPGLHRTLKSKSTGGLGLSLLPRAHALCCMPLEPSYCVAWLLRLAGFLTHLALLRLGILHVHCMSGCGDVGFWQLQKAALRLSAVETG